MLPLTTLAICTATMSFADFWKIVSSPQVVSAYKLSFGASFLAASINAVFGFIVAWTLVRYKFPGRRFIDALIDIPFAMPTAVSGIALTAICAKNGWIGSLFWFEPHEPRPCWIASWTGFEPHGILPEGEPYGIEIAYSQIGIVIALIFIGLPFVVRTLQPALEDLDKEVEEAAESLGATRWQTFYKIIFPSVFPALMTGFTLALARALGEYGSVVFISGNKILETQIVPMLIIQQLDQFNTPAATAIAVVMLAASFFLLFCINLIQWYARRRT
jgi:sulfate transport system permease protein